MTSILSLLIFLGVFFLLLIVSVGGAILCWFIDYQFLGIDLEVQCPSFRKRAYHKALYMAWGTLLSITLWGLYRLAYQALTN